MERMSMTENEAIRVLKNGWNFAILLEDKQLIDMAIQALEEIQQIKEIISNFPLDCGSPVEDIKEIYRQLRGFLQIGTIDEFKALKEKSEPKEPRWHGHHFCPHCNSIVFVNGGKNRYCTSCGQKLDWSE